MTREAALERIAGEVAGLLCRHVQALAVRLETAGFTATEIAPALDEAVRLQADAYLPVLEAVADLFDDPALRDPA